MVIMIERSDGVCGTAKEGAGTLLPDTVRTWLRWVASFLTGALCAVGLCGATGPQATAQTVDARHEFSGWLGGSFDRVLVSHAGLRSIPELSVGYALTDDVALDADAALQLRVELRRGEAPDANAELHRLSLRIASERMELRAGLQKLNFGSALLVRPLMWFDRVDPRDPLAVASGVRGILARGTMQNNASLWLWALYGNDEPRGIDADATVRHTPEFGGRVQLPMGAGEAAVTFHHRRAYGVAAGSAAGASAPQGQSSVLGQISTAGASSLHENRIGLDGKWDVGIGIWGEGVLMHRGARGDATWTSLATLGADYTFAWGNGLGITCEHAVGQGGARLGALAETAQLTALAATYPLDALHGASVMVFHDWRSGNWYRLASLARTEDVWSAHLLLFWNPARDLAAWGGSAFGGSGFMLLAAIYH